MNFFVLSSGKSPLPLFAKEGDFFSCLIYLAHLCLILLIFQYKIRETILKSSNVFPSLLKREIFFSCLIYLAHLRLVLLIF